MSNQLADYLVIGFHIGLIVGTLYLWSHQDALIRLITHKE